MIRFQAVFICHANLTMPRRARLELPGVPMHIMQRGVNRRSVFMDTDDREHYLRLLRRASKAQGISVHAYVLMGNHVHLLVTAQELGSISAAMHRLGQCYVQAFNRKHQRTGTLWEGRFKSCLVDTETYLLTVYRYIEQNPVRAAMIDSPEQYHWSSARGNLGLRSDPLLTPHPAFLALASDPETRVSVYAQWLMQGTCSKELDAIRAYLEQGKTLGSARFQKMVEQTTGRVASWRPRGRPPRGGKELD